jgi:hypothetical protein
MTEKRFNTRIIHKHETEANWLLSSLIPLQGELIVYDIDSTHTYERIKIGDGVQNVNSLQFYAGSWDDLKNKPFEPVVRPVCEYSETLQAGSTTTAYGLLPVGYIGSNRKVHIHDNAILTVRVGETEWTLDKSLINISATMTVDVGQYNGIDVKVKFRIDRASGTYSAAINLSAALTDSVDVYMSYGLLFSVINKDSLPDTVVTKEYVDEAISAIPTPDVSGQIEAHNTSEDAHSDIRTAISDLKTLVGDTSVQDQIEAANMIYVGPDKPTDPNIKVWINTAEEGTGAVPVMPRITTITLSASAWAGSSAPYSQVVEANTVTAATKIELNPTVSQIVSLQSEDIALTAENNNGVVTVYSFGGKPSADMTMQVTLMEVSYV